jgi:hypothetical protein
MLSMPASCRCVPEARVATSKRYSNATQHRLMGSWLELARSTTKSISIIHGHTGIQVIGAHLQLAVARVLCLVEAQRGLSTGIVEAY